jgi:hypothetical protein
MKRPPRGKSRPESKPRRRPGRHSPPPPAILHGPHETLEGTRVLDELREGTGVLLWQALRDVTLWASIPPEEREELFRPGAAAATRAAVARVDPDEDLYPALATWTALLEEPARAREEELSAACLQVTRWAEAHGALGTALAFAQGAAIASPAEAAAALETGSLALRVGEEARAESWFRRAIGQGRRSGDRLSWCRACLALGKVHARRGQASTARVLLLRALRGGRRRGFREVVSEALHALFLLEAGAGRGAEAEGYARTLLRVLRRGDPRLSQAARDVAAFRVEAERFAEAVSGLDALLPRAGSPRERFALLGALARAAGCGGDVPRFEETTREAWALLEETLQPGMEEVDPLLDLARGAAALRRWASAERAAQRALTVSVKAGDDDAASRAEALLSAIWTEAGGMRWGAPPPGE